MRCNFVCVNVLRAASQRRLADQKQVQRHHLCTPMSPVVANSPGGGTGADVFLPFAISVHYLIPLPIAFYLHPESLSMPTVDLSRVER